MKLSRGAGVIFGFIVCAMAAFFWAPGKCRDFLRRLKKEARSGRTGLRAVKESINGMGREIIDADI